MSSKVKLGATPKTFAPTAIKFPKPDGEQGEIVTTFKYRKRSEFGEFLNSIHNDAGLAPQAAEKVDFKALFEKTRDKNADHLLACVEGWDLDDKLTRESLQALADELPAAAIAMMSSYSELCTEGRVKN